MRGPGPTACTTARPAVLDIRCNKDLRCGSPLLPAREWSSRCAGERGPACSLLGRPPGQDIYFLEDRRRRQLYPARSPKDTEHRSAADISVRGLEFQGGWSRLGFYRMLPRSLFA